MTETTRPALPLAYRSGARPAALPSYTVSPAGQRFKQRASPPGAAQARAPNRPLWGDVRYRADCVRFTPERSYPNYDPTPVVSGTAGDDPNQPFGPQSDERLASATTSHSSSMVALQSNHSTCHANRAESLICGIKTGRSVSGLTIEIRSHQITAGSCLPGRICSAGGIRDTEIKLR